MNCTLHWFLRDLRRHVVATGLWLVLVALFTWARYWFRTHPHIRIPDRDLWLSIPAGALGFAEMCFIVGIMLDDPLRGTSAFWKTRPLGGGAVFAAKMLMVAVVGLAIPLSAEAVFLILAGPSGGAETRWALYLLVPSLAVLAGVSSLNWKGALIWLPVVAGALIASLGVAQVYEYFFSGIIRYTDVRLVAAALLAAVVVGGFLVCRRRCRQRLMVTGYLVVSMLAATSVLCTGWPRDPRLSEASPRMHAENITVGWSNTKVPYVKRLDTNGPGRFFLSLPLLTSNLQEGFHWTGGIKDVVVMNSGGERLSVRRRPSGWMTVPPNLLKAWKAEWMVEVDGSEANQFLRENGKYSVSATMVYTAYRWQHHEVPPEGKSYVETSYGTWVVNPSVQLEGWPDADHTGLRVDWEYVDSWANSNKRRSWVDSDSISLVQAGNGAVLSKYQFGLDTYTNLWEGHGRGKEWLRLPLKMATRNGELDQLKDTLATGNWRLEMDTLTLEGTAVVPFELEWVQ